MANDKKKMRDNGAEYRGSKGPTVREAVTQCELQATFTPKANRRSQDPQVMANQGLLVMPKMGVRLIFCRKLDYSHA